MDEIGELPLDVQPKLLRVLEARSFQRVGSGKVQTCDVRVIAATKRDLEAEVAAGRFREDLYFRLAVVPVHVPPLRDRKEDIPLLASRIVSGLAPGREVGLNASAAELLGAHHWPGNVRELRNVLERALLLSPGNLLDAPALGLFTESSEDDR